MQTLIYEVGDKPKVTIQSIGGDLRISGRQEEQVEIKAYSDDVDVVQNGDSLIINCPSDCLIFLPNDSAINAEAIGGDVRATNVRGEMMLRIIGGDLSLRGMGKGTFETIGGSLHVRKGTGDISIDRVGGDAVVDRISGNVKLRSVGGDLRLRRVDGAVEVDVGGDASVMFTTLGGKCVSVKAGGDLSCYLPGDSSAKVSVSAGGDIHIPNSIEVEDKGTGKVFKLRDGQIPVDLIAGGKLWLQGDKSSDDLLYANLGESIASQIETEVEAGITQMEATLEAIGAGVGAFSSERIGEQVRRAVTRARRKAEQGKKRAERARRRAGKKSRSIKHNLSGRSAGRPEDSEDEHLSILRMLEKGTITVEEAEKLLQALEGSA